MKQDVADWQGPAIRDHSEVVELVRALVPEPTGREEVRSAQDRVAALTEAVTALASEGWEPDAAVEELEAALEEISRGRTGAAQKFLQRMAAQYEARGRDALRKAAEAQRHIGALAFSYDPRRALLAYRRATELDPGNPEDWKELKELLERTTHQSEVESVSGGDVLQAKANGGARRVRLYHGHLSLRCDEALEVLEEQLAADRKLGRYPEMAATYCSLGVIHQFLGDLDEAAAMYEKSLAMHRKLGNREGMARDCHNLANAHRARGDLERAAHAYMRARKLYAEIGCADMVLTVEGSIERLKEPLSGN